MTRRERREARSGLLFVLPWMLGFLIFTLYPILCSLYYSMCNYSVIGAPKFIGAANYINLLRDRTFLASCFNTAYMILIGVPVTTVIAVTVSVLLNYRKLRGTGWMRVVFFVPTLVPTVVACLLWIWVMQPDSGIVNTLLGYIGIRGPGWLSSPAWAKPAFLLMMIWTCGNAVIIYLAGLQDISPTLYDAAAIDGAGFVRQSFYITVPLLRPTILYNVVTLIIGVFQWFAEPYIMTEGGPSNATMFYSLYLYQNAFTFFKMGYASAQAWIMLLMAMIIIAALFKGFRFGETEMG
ncbi:carbohydrate ABC transporter permease [Lachnoclostridium sp. Marseille-P6806]|uniref:carbohydrate ABC transporter permease n=1 Tax=Lachnoclostridium sp. Marseille-P6806 TaxID=2364793 RepID=UPI0010324A04|nr:sugar ABC transporter permease [Lachnoclostridium sp. Marseille-P6806]